MEILSTSLPAVVSAFAVLAGVWVAQRHQRMIAAEARVEARRDAQRRVVADVVSAATTKYESYLLFVPILANFRSLSQKDQFELADSETVKRLGEASATLDRALIDATLLVGDEVLLAAIIELRKANLTLRDRLTDDKSEDRVGDAFGALHEFGRAYRDLEEKAVRFLPVPLGGAKSG